VGAVWDKAAAAAQKIVGKDGKIPDLPASLDKAGDDREKAQDEFDKARDECEDKLVKVQNANDAVKNGTKQFLAKIEKDDLGLDPKKKEDLKKIQQARKVLTDIIEKVIKNNTDDDKMLDELDKHLVQLGKYKPKPVPV
jgi:hypothetical protein